MSSLIAGAIKVRIDNGLTYVLNNNNRIKM